MFSPNRGSPLNNSINNQPMVDYEPQFNYIFIYLCKPEVFYFVENLHFSTLNYKKVYPLPHKL